MGYLDVTNNLGKDIDTSRPEFWKERNEKLYNLLGLKPTDAEGMFISILDSLNMPYFTELEFDTFLNQNNNPYRFDFGIIKKTEDNRILLLCMVEIDGSGHTLRRDWREVDAAKEKFCKDINVSFNRINYMELIFNNHLIKTYLKEVFESNNFYDIKSVPGFARFSMEPLT